MSHAMALELLEGVEALKTAIQLRAESEPDSAQAKYLRASADLLETAIARLQEFLAGKASLSEANVYLYVNSLNKGLLEIGANWTDDPHIAAALADVTRAAYGYFKQTR